MKKIIGITIGPILETIYESKEIFQISGASLFFSTIMKGVLLSLLELKDDYTIITPSLEEEEDFLPDRAVLEVKNERSLKENIKDVEDIYYEILRKNDLEELKEYINFNIVGKELEEERVTEIFPALDGIELIKNFPNTFDFKRFHEVTKYYLGIRRERDYDKNLYYKSNAETGAYKAIVALDIDNMSKFSQNDIKKIKKISKAISEYIGELKGYLEKKDEGFVIYSAGDDVLAILNPKNVIEFIKFACEKLNEIFKEFHNENKELSVSFGIFICYKKYPIKEAIEKAHYQLFEVAKNNKNSAALLVEKHSGQSFSLVLKELIKKENSENTFNENKKFKIIQKNTEAIFNGEDNKSKNMLLNTIIQKISSNAFVFNCIISDKQKIKYYLNNLFELSNDVTELADNHPVKIIYDLFCIMPNKDKKKIEEFERDLDTDILAVIKLLKFYSGRN